jgi:hypothetical protein
MKDYSQIADKLKGLNDPFLTGLDPKQVDFGPSFTPSTPDIDRDFDVPLSGYEAGRTIARRSVLDDETIETLAATPNLTADEQELVNRYSNSEFTFGVPGVSVHAKWHKNTWLCTATDEETDEKQSFKLGGLDKFDRDSVMTGCARYLKPRALWKELTEDELITVSRIASGGDMRAMENAVMTYLNYALPGIDRDVSQEKAYQPLADQICWFCFRHGHVDIDDGAEQWMRHQLADRPATIQRLYAVYEMWKDEKQKRNRSALFNPPVEQDDPQTIQEQLDDLSDSQIENLRMQTMRLANRR